LKLQQIRADTAAAAMRRDPMLASTAPRRGSSRRDEPNALDHGFLGRGA